MEVKLSREFEKKIETLMKELGISGQWYLEPHIENHWKYGSPFPEKVITYTLDICIKVPDDKLEIR